MLATCASTLAQISAMLALPPRVSTTEDSGTGLATAVVKRPPRARRVPKYFILEGGLLQLRRNKRIGASRVRMMTMLDAESEERAKMGTCCLIDRRRCSRFKEEEA
jgi:hypothetical protein